jgi:FkbM family methyltransferase
LNVSVVDYTAVSNVQLNFEHSGNLRNNIGGFSVVHPWVRHPNHSAALLDEVPVVSLDSFRWFDDAKTCPRLIKLDVEGVEARVLSGARQTIASCLPILHVEANVVEQSPSVLQFFQTHNYTTYWEVSHYLQEASYLAETAVPPTSLVSTNFLALPPWYDRDSYPEQYKWLLAALTPASPDKPSVTLLPHVIAPLVKPSLVREQRHGNGFTTLSMVENTGYEQLQMVK